MTTKLYQTHVYATVRITLECAPETALSPHQVACLTADAVSTEPEQWLRSTLGALKVNGVARSVESVVFADEITHVVVDELDLNDDCAVIEGHDFDAATLNGDEDGLDLYPFCDDETATLWDTPALTGVSVRLKEMTDDMLRDFYFDNTNTHVTRKELSEWSRARVAQAVWVDLCLILNRAALVPRHYRTELATLGRVLASTMKDDSSTYQACKLFNDYLTEIAIKIIPFPEADLKNETYYKDML